MLEIRVAHDTSAQATLLFPPHLFPDLVLRGIATAFIAALQNAGAVDVTFAPLRSDASHAFFEGRWR
jgi:hypothetical protein